MSDSTTSKGNWITYVILASLLLATAIPTVCLWLLGDWENHATGLNLTWKILWGCCIVGCLAVVLTNVTIFGWSFRRYFRWDGPGRPAWARFRPTQAPWTKSGALSFGITVAIVSVTGALAIAAVVMWILSDFIGAKVFWLIITILGSTWWVAIITLVLVRVGVFGWQRRQALQAKMAGPGQHEDAVAGSGRGEKS